MAGAARKTIILIDGNSLSIDKLPLIADGAPLAMPLSSQKRVEASQQLVKAIGGNAHPVYGINTGFGFFANKRISANQLEELQLNLIKSHAAGFGAPLPPGETRLAMVLRLNVLVKGYTGVRFKLCQALFDLLQHDILPLIPEYGSVGASGDLAPLAHLALPLLGLGMVRYKGQLMSAKEALKEAKLKPLKLSIKEGLGLINGTQVMLAVGGLALAEACRLATLFDKAAALTYEGLVGHLDALSPLIQSVRPHQGQRETAAAILKELEGSYLFDETTVRPRVQDPYSLRCVPQVHGTSREMQAFASSIVNVELNSVTDNPIVFTESKKILSGGNFHGQPIAFAYDTAAMAMAELCNISERRLEQLLNPHLSGLPAFLSPNEGLHSGYMTSQYLSASIVNENKLLSNPACTDSIPGNAGIEDHVSMGMTSARKLRKIVENAKAVLAVEMLAAAQAIDLRKVPKLGKGTGKIYTALRKKVPFLDHDRIISEDIKKAIELIDTL